MANSARRGEAIAVLLALVAGLLFGVTPPAHAQQALPCDGGGYDPGSYSHVSEKGPYKAMPQEIVELESDIDGATIQMGVIRPKVPAGVKVPVVVTASVYLHPLQDMDLRNCRPFLINNYVPHGYAVVVLAVRGTADAGGCMDLMGPKERGDLDQTITWLGKQPWSNGSVAMIGKSYDGSTPWMVAAFGNPYLKTIVTSEGVPDLFELMYGAGTADWRGPAILSDIYYAQSAVFYAPGRSPGHTVEVTACPDYAVGTAASLYSGATGLMDPAGYWADRRYKDEIEKKYDGSIFMLQGLQDWNVNPGQQYPWIKKLEAKGNFVKHMIGQWGHSWPDQEGDHLRPDFADILLNWFDRWLKGDRSADLGPKAEVEDDSGLWRVSSNWPPPRGVAHRLWLDPSGALSSKPPKEEGSDVVAFDPVHTQLGYSTSMPPDGLQDMCVPGSCAMFETGPMKEDFRIAGLPELDLTVVPTGPGGGLSAYLYEISDDGARRVGWAQVNLAFKAPGEMRPVTPGQEMKVRFDMQPLDAAVEKGSTLALLISHGSGWNRLLSVPSFPIEILEGPKASSLELFEPSVSPADFFVPK